MSSSLCPICPVCNERVYHAEKRVAAGTVYHIRCFKCNKCSKNLDSTNCCDHDSQLYCKNCHRKMFGIQGYGFGCGAGTLSMRSKITATSLPEYYKDSNRLMPGTSESTSRKCHGCGHAVYKAEEIQANRVVWHKRCFKCAICNKRLDSITRNDGPEGSLYCTSCYSRNYGPRGYGYGKGAGTLQMSPESKKNKMLGEFTPTSRQKPPDGEGCPRCGDYVYEAEKMQTRYRSYHTKCYVCLHCKTALDSTKACDGPDKEVYCRLCYSRIFGPKGYGFGCGAAFLQSDSISRSDNVNKQKNTTCIRAEEGKGCPRCGGVVHAAERIYAKNRGWHKSCFTCKVCRRVLDSMSHCNGADGEVYCNTHYTQYFGIQGFGYGHAPTLVCGGSQTMTTPNGVVLQTSMGCKPEAGKGCPRCGYHVYAAESVTVRNRDYHQRCYNCYSCHKSLSSTNACDGPDNEVYCSGCYSRLFGPRGVGYGIGAGVLSMR